MFSQSARAAHTDGFAPEDADRARARRSSRCPLHRHLRRRRPPSTGAARECPAPGIAASLRTTEVGNG